MKPQVDRGLDAEEKTNKMHVIDMKPVLFTGQEWSKEGASLSGSHQHIFHKELREPIQKNAVIHDFRGIGRVHKTVVGCKINSA